MFSTKTESEVRRRYENCFKCFSHVREQRELGFPSDICEMSQNERRSAGPSCGDAVSQLILGSDRISPQFPVPLTSAGFPE